jgi:hypothetical protein
MVLDFPRTHGHRERLANHNSVLLCSHSPSRFHSFTVGRGRQSLGGSKLRIQDCLHPPLELGALPEEVEFSRASDQAGSKTVIDS